MLGTEKIIDSFHRIESTERHFNHNGTPVAHSTVPQTWQLQSLQLLAALALVSLVVNGHAAAIKLLFLDRNLLPARVRAARDVRLPSSRKPCDDR